MDIDLGSVEVSPLGREIKYSYTLQEHPYESPCRSVSSQTIPSFQEVNKRKKLFKKIFVYSQLAVYDFYLMKNYYLSNQFKFPIANFDDSLGNVLIMTVHNSYDYNEKDSLDIESERSEDIDIVIFQNGTIVMWNLFDKIIAKQIMIELIDVGSSKVVLEKRLTFYSEHRIENERNYIFKKIYGKGDNSLSSQFHELEQDDSEEAFSFSPMTIVRSIYDGYKGETNETTFKVDIEKEPETKDETDLIFKNFDRECIPEDKLLNFEYYVLEGATFGSETGPDITDTETIHERIKESNIMDDSIKNIVNREASNEGEYMESDGDVQVCDPKVFSFMDALLPNVIDTQTALEIPGQNPVRIDEVMRKSKGRNEDRPQYTSLTCNKKKKNRKSLIINQQGKNLELLKSNLLFTQNFFPQTIPVTSSPYSLNQSPPVSQNVMFRLLGTFYKKILSNPHTLDATPPLSLRVPLLAGTASVSPRSGLHSVSRLISKPVPRNKREKMVPETLADTFFFCSKVSLPLAYHRKIPSSRCHLDVLFLSGETIHEKIAVSYAIMQSSRLRLYEQTFVLNASKLDTIPISLIKNKSVKNIKLLRDVSKILLQLMEIEGTEEFCSLPSSLLYPSMENHLKIYNKVHAYLNIQHRVELLHNRYNVVKELFSVVDELFKEQIAVRLTWIIILLLAVNCIAKLAEIIFF